MTGPEQPPEFRLAVTGSPGYDDRAALRASLDRIFDSIPADVILVIAVMQRAVGAEAIAADWVLELARSGMPVRMEEVPDEQVITSWADRGLAALLPGDDNAAPKAVLTRMFQAGIEFEIVVQGKGKGLPEDLIRPGEPT